MVEEIVNLFETLFLQKKYLDNSTMIKKDSPVRTLSNF